jgi:ubiquinone/menaquinone biosynthesis C-methylase UbiE
MDPQDVVDVFDRAATTYDTSPFPFFTPFGEALVEFAQIRPDERVLDVGCGSGAALAPAARDAASATGIELSPAMAKRARSAVPEVEVLVGDAATLPFPDSSFDVVLSAFTVFFMPDPTSALREWRRVLTPGGRLVMATWDGGDPRWSWEREVRMPFVRELDPKTLQELMAGIEFVNRFDDATKVEDELRAADFTSEVVTPHVIEFTFADEDAWWEWNWSHGARLFLEELSDEALRRFREQAYDAMQRLRTEAGFPRRFTALFCRALP